MTETDVRFYFDPVCPFAWMTSKWVRMVAAQRDYTVDWRFISLRLINSAIDYDSHFPAGYEEGHTSGLRLLRVAARVRAEQGRAAVGPFYEAVSGEIFDAPGAAGLTPATRGSRAFVEPLLAAAGLPAGLAGALDETRWDEEIRAEGDEALALTGRDVGTPIIHFSPPAGAAFFGPVISRLPGPEDAVRLWDHVTALAGFPGFAEFKRSLRERPQLRSFGVDPGAAGTEEDWHAGSRKTGSLPEAGHRHPFGNPQNHYPERMAVTRYPGRVPARRASGPVRRCDQKAGFMDYADALTAQNRELAELLRDADWSIPVPTCPGWTLLQLLRHVGRGDRWAAQIITSRADTSLDPRSVSDGKPPADAPGAIRWLTQSPQILLAAVAGIGPGTEVATFTGQKPAAWWTRRRLHEATVHRADAAIALGVPYELPAELAADGISEWLERLAGQQALGQPSSLPAGASLALRATDQDLTEGTWSVLGSPEGVHWHGRPAAADLTLSGPAADLLLALLRRRPAEETGISMQGDTALWRSWLALTPL